MNVTARVQRSGDRWAVEVPEVPGVFTQAKRLEQVPDQVRDAIATMLDDVEATDVVVELDPVLPEPAGQYLATAREAAEAARWMQENATHAVRYAVAALRDDEHLTTRDTAMLLGISHQRVAQIAAASNR